MKTSSAKNKGRRACQEVRDLLFKFAPDLKPDDIQVTPSGVTGEDLHLSPAAQEVYPLTIECKNQEKLELWAAIKQSESHAKEGRYPTLFFRRNHSELYVVLKAEHFMKLVR